MKQTRSNKTPAEIKSLTLHWPYSKTHKYQNNTNFFHLLSPTEDGQAKISNGKEHTFSSSIKYRQCHTKRPNTIDSEILWDSLGFT